MAAYRIRWTRRALRRLDEIGAYVERDNPVAAASVVARIAAAVDLLVDHPEMGRTGRAKGTRELVLADISYVVPYRVGVADIEIITVMHVAQKWPLTF